MKVPKLDRARNKMKTRRTDQRVDVAALSVVALMVLLITVPAAASSTIPFECTTDGGGNWTISATQPHAVTIDNPDGTTSLGTEIEYKVTSNYGLSPDHVLVLAGYGVDVVIPEARNVYEPCVGDTGTTYLGIHDCSSIAVRMNKNNDTQTFELAVLGDEDPTNSSIVVKKGKVIEECRIASLGKRDDTFDPHAQVTAAQEITFKGCTVTIPTDTSTGEGGVATITGDNCVFVANAEPVSVGELVVNGQSVGTLTFGDGSLSSGTASCTTKVISRRIYTWCTCADVDGDGVPDDPIPPCPATVP